VRLEIRREDAAIEAHLEQTREMRRRIAWRDRACRALSLLLPGSHAYFSERPIRGFAVLFGFFFALAAAVIGWRFFEIRPLTPGLAWRPLAVLAAAAAALIWLIGNASAWRKSHGA
jgi:hypothetical protein